MGDLAQRGGAGAVGRRCFWDVGDGDALHFTDFFLLRFFLCLPIIAGIRRHRWDFVHLGWPMLTVPVCFLLLLWREFSLPDLVSA